MSSLIKNNGNNRKTMSNSIKISIFIPFRGYLYKILMTIFDSLVQNILI